MSEELRLVPWFDRNPKVIFLSYTMTGISPHSTTQRWVYIVPKGRKAFLEYAIAKIQRHTAATEGEAGYAQSQIKYQPNGQDDNHLIFANLESNNKVDDKDEVYVGHALVMLAGDILRGRTLDLSTLGSCNYHVVAKLTEFDAFPIERPPFQVELPKVDIQEPEKPWWHWW